MAGDLRPLSENVVQMTSHPAFDSPLRLKYLWTASALVVLAVGGAAGDVTVGVVSVKSMPLARSLTISSELVPFQEIEVYAKESGYVKQLLVDYGSRVQAGPLLAVLE